LPAFAADLLEAPVLVQDLPQPLAAYAHPAAGLAGQVEQTPALLAVQEWAEGNGFCVLTRP
jgi:hypothetical protein